MGGGTTTQKTQTRSDPWAPAQPHLKFGLEESRRLYDAGADRRANDAKRGEAWREEGLQGMRSTMEQNRGYLNQAANAVGGIQSQGGMSGGMRGALGQMQGVGAGYRGLTDAARQQVAGTGGVQALAQGYSGLGNYERAAGGVGAGAMGRTGQLMGPQGSAAGFGALQGIAQGQGLGGNPYLSGLIDKQAGKLANDINSQFSSAGRYGSGAHQAQLGDQLTNLRTTALSQAYEPERQRQVQAAQFLDQSGRANRGQNLQAAQQFYGMQGRNFDRGAGLAQQQIQNQVQAQGQLHGQHMGGLAAARAGLKGQQGVARDQFRAGQQGISNQFRAAAMTPGMANARLSPYQQLMQMGTGAMNAPQQALQQYFSTGARAGGLGGTSNSTSTVRQPSNPWGALLGAGATALGGYLSGGGSFWK